MIWSTRYTEAASVSRNQSQFPLDRQPRMSASDRALPPNCPNCAAPVTGPYCAQCGQETLIKVPTLREFGHEYLHTFVSLEGRLWRTLWLLVSRPGELTTEFLAGRRRRYVRPLPLYLSLSFVFFLLLAMPSADSPFDDTKTKPGTAAKIELNDAERAELRTFDIDAESPLWLKPIAKRYKKSLERLHGDPKLAGQALTAAFLAKLPYAMFFLLPAFAALTALAYRRRRRAYTEHLLFALHMHAFAYLCLSVMVLMPGEGPVGLMLLLWWAYLALALRRVYGGRLIPQVLRSLPVLIGHSLVLVAVMLLVLVLAVPAI